MGEANRGSALFPALLRHWRTRRGLSQLDLALASNVSNRHVSFLETGRSSPSADMVLRLAAALDVPLRHVNAMLEAAGFDAHYPDARADGALPDEVMHALGMMKRHHEPFPLVVLNRRYDVVDLNAGAMALLSAALGPLDAAAGQLNLARATFDPDGAQPALLNFDEVGRTLLWRLQREVLADPNDAALRTVLDDVLAMPTVPEDWRTPDLSVPSTAALVLRLKVGKQVLSFVTMVTAFQAPQAVALDELRIETWFPNDEQTERACRGLVGG